MRALRLLPKHRHVVSILALLVVSGPAAAQDDAAQAQAMNGLAVAGVDEMARPMGVLGHSCGTLDPTAGEANSVNTALRRWLDENPSRPVGGIVRVAVHVITARGEGHVTDAQIASLIRKLNSDFTGTGYGFELSSVDRTENLGWFRMTPGSGKERQAKQALALDPAHRLNVYLCSPGQGLTGWASFPWSAPEGNDLHGVVISTSSLPRQEPPVTLRRAATHEVGHYLGLTHTTSPIQDETLIGFSPGQVERMHEVVPVFKPSLFSTPAGPAAAQPEIQPGAGAEPEEGRVLSYRGAFPNPFRAETALRFSLPASQPVSLRIYSVTGQQVRTLVDATLPPGDHSALFRADDLPSGAYFAVLRVGHVQMSRTVMLIR